jgi:hypothetical protein
MARLYADENLPLGAAVELRQMGHDVVTALEAGQANQGFPDEDVLAFAIGLGRAVFTLNRGHFIHLHKRSDRHSGIVVCSGDNDLTALARRIDHALSGQGPLENRLVRVNKPAKP